MGGKAVKDVRPLEWNEIKSTYEWVEKNIFPLILLTKEDAIPIGSFGKKPKGETYGDIDIAIDANKFKPLKFEDVAIAIDCVLSEECGFETSFIKGIDQVSVKVPICGDESKGFAQIDLMPTTNLKWAKFIYHSPNLAEDESKYKGAVRNALLMAILSESTKEITKLFEGKAEEYTSLAIRFPTGVWSLKKSFMGKSGKIIKLGALLESEFITNEPQDVIDLILGEGYKIGAANSFETLWEIIHRKNFIHKNKLNEIMSKFKENLKSMQQQIPEEAKYKYPEILTEGLEDILKYFKKDPKKKSHKIADLIIDNPQLIGQYKYILDNLEEDDVIRIIINRPLLATFFQSILKRLSNEAKKFILKKHPNLDYIITEGIEDIFKPKKEESVKKEAEKIFYESPTLAQLRTLNQTGLLQLFPIEEIREAILNSVKNSTHRSHLLIREKDWLKDYLTPENWNEIELEIKFEEFLEKVRNQRGMQFHKPKTKKELSDLKKRYKFAVKKEYFEKFLKFLKGDLPHKSIQKIVNQRIKNNQFKFFVTAYEIFKKYAPLSDSIWGFFQQGINLIDNSEEVSRSQFRKYMGKQWGLNWIDSLTKEGMFILFKKGNKQYLKLNKSYTDSKEYVEREYYKFLNELTENIEKYNISGLYEGKI